MNKKDILKELITIRKKTWKNYCLIGKMYMEIETLNGKKIKFVPEYLLDRPNDFFKDYDNMQTWKDLNKLIKKIKGDLNE